MGISKQTTFTLSCAVALSALVPGAAGYLSGRLAAVESAERELHAIETRLNAREAREDREAWPVALPAPCDGTRTAREREGRVPAPRQRVAPPQAPQAGEVRPPAPDTRPPAPKAEQSHPALGWLLQRLRLND
ncbi:MULTISPECIES: hypothetical protein [unclassified Nonomuraea]|uniref:hypothetical protein n=1 Tax=unclassified Nonomuraea TaxID=2593643 RepID=UPI0033F67DC5